MPGTYMYDNGKWWRFLPRTRFNMDEVGLSIGLGNKQTWTFPNERLTGKVSIAGGRESRFATMMLTTCADHTVKVPPGMIFQGQGKISMIMRNKLKKKSDSSGVEYTFQKKAWVDEERLMWWFNTCFLPMKLEKFGPDVWTLLFLDACGKTHMVAPFKNLCAENKVLCWYGEPNMTDSWQPIDCSVGKTTRVMSLAFSAGSSALP